MPPGALRLVLGRHHFAGPGRQGWEGWSWAVIDSEGCVRERSSGYYGRRATAETIGTWHASRYLKPGEELRIVERRDERPAEALDLCPVEMLERAQERDLT